MIKRFQETGSVKDRQRIGRPKSATNIDKSLKMMFVKHLWKIFILNFKKGSTMALLA